MSQGRLAMVIKKMREERGWSQRDLAARAGVTGAYVAQLETGTKQNPSDDILRRFARALRVPFKVLKGTIMLPREWWRPEPDRELTDAAELARGPFFATRDEAETEARRRGLTVVARYQDKPGGFIRRAFPIRTE